ncbi:uncharacterized protein LOC108212812 [Daucus carota subsp. sativus]|nr:PREDICTED: uncharacterized protein LOC108212812 [Daucus carota subsp. sativus]
MSFINNFDLNLSPRSDELHSNDSRQIDLNKDLEDVSDEETLHLGQMELAIDSNQPLLDHSEQDGFEEGHDGSQGEQDSRLQSQRASRKNKNLSNEDRRRIYQTLLTKSVDGKLRRGTIREVSAIFSISSRTVARIWKQATQSSNNGAINVSHKRSKNCGRKRIEIDPEQIKKVPLSRRTSLESLAYAINVSKSTLHRNFKSGRLRRHSNHVKPYLKDSNKKARAQFSLSMIDKSSLPHDPHFKDMNDMIHIDEKWFYISKKAEKYYLLPEESDPVRTCKSKNFLTKVMFLTAIARPRFDSDGKEVFSGKIGIFPFVTKEPAKRSSANRPAGTLETKPITSVGRDIARTFLITKVLPAILEKWPARDVNKPILIQQDNARTHINPDDEEFRLAVQRCGLNVQLICQPPNSPDLNVLDLGFFSAIQNLHYKEAPRTVDELITSVENAYNAFSTVKSNRIFLTLQQCMIEIMKARGSNGYKIPHMKKGSLERNGKLPSTSVRCKTCRRDDELAELFLISLARTVISYQSCCIC